MPHPPPAYWKSTAATSPFAAKQKFASFASPWTIVRYRAAESVRSMTGLPSGARRPPSRPARRGASRDASRYRQARGLTGLLRGTAHAARRARRGRNATSRDCRVGDAPHSRQHRGPPGRTANRRALPAERSASRRGIPSTAERTSGTTPPRLRRSDASSHRRAGRPDAEARPTSRQRSGHRLQQARRARFRRSRPTRSECARSGGLRVLDTPARSNRDRPPSACPQIEHGCSPSARTPPPR
jgi:hypothetical protein